MAKYSGLWTLTQQSQANGTNLWPRRPGAPTIGTATAGVSSASVTFTAPTDLGVPAATTYTATSNPGNITGTASSSPITVSGLTNGVSYTFTVTATNPSGTGPASAASNSVTPQLSFVWATTAPSNTNMTFSNGNRTAANGGNTSWYQTAFAALPTNSGGKYYWEVTESISNPYANIGVGNSTSNDIFYQDATGPWYVQRSENSQFTISTWTGVTGSVSRYDNTNARYGFAYDIDTRKLWVRQNGGSWIGGGDPTNTSSTPSVTTSGTTYLVGATYNTSDQSFTITSKNSLTDSVPSGYTAIGGT